MPGPGQQDKVVLVTLLVAVMSDNSLSPPSHSDEVKVSFPMEHVVLLTMNRPKFLNAMLPTMEGNLEILLNWFEEEPSLWFVCA